MGYRAPRSVDIPRYSEGGRHRGHDPLGYRGLRDAAGLLVHAYRARILALPDAIAAASGARREELCRIVVERVVVRDRQLETIDWTPPARPFFERQREYPQGDSNPWSPP